ncbi:hypothetical protein EI77_02049 [Prosthecobacter fusiformis]|uniref:Uncharacterized protein n=1 Tax=Prosthecobacter fusiformis TaxID=48464 RepID=A0A4R7RYK2_9BACT|nr:hypothetical protein [Prosthecobacter fusiformis]TDU70931.1 hypothetical protein EI77_02049 [Prosthecobacter fusiformis]
MPKVPPAILLLVLVVIGAVVGLFVSNQPAQSTIEAGKVDIQPVVNGLPLTEQEDLPAQITLLEGQVEYLQGQVNALQEENALLIQKLGTLGMKGIPKMDPATATDTEDDPPDFVGMGIELMKFRQIQALPTPTVGATLAEVEAAILTWMRKQQPEDEGPRFALALTALGWIDKPVDPLPVRAALWARQLGGWYNQESGTLLIMEDNPEPGKPAPDRPLAITFGQLLREYGSTLFPEERTSPLTTDERLARESLLAGDAGLTRFLYSLQNPDAAPKSDLPAEDPDHPLNEVQAPAFLRELAMFPFRPGFEFAQTLHSAGNFAQLNAAYSRPPRDCAEIIEAERYLDNTALPPSRPEFPNVKVGESEPYWDDSLGRFAIFNALRTYNSDEEAGQAARGWQSDRLLAYAAPDQPRDHAAWQTQWLTPEHATAFFKAMRNCLLQRYDVEAKTDSADVVSLEAGGRYILLLRNRNGQGVLLVDAATAEFAQGLRSTLDSVSKGAQ